ncbi:MAG: hypothetical protein M1168_02735 [Candidatus Marsarchaeota archaeon]|nr:hypothetical protein [Candidatus Marsarchaeota archaeon]MCL5094872.1 hypothetical protein [Candidatus Marsarchaeota archaeon]
MEQRNKKDIEKQLLDIKKKLSLLTDQNKDKQIVDINKSQNINSNMFALIKYMIDENKRTTMLLENITQTIGKLEESLKEPEINKKTINNTKNEINNQVDLGSPKKQIILPEPDVKIIQLIQLSNSNMVCADDIKAKLNYKGRNAACSRLNRLYKLGILERHQVGHKVYYKYDAGKANLFIISPN